MPGGLRIRHFAVLAAIGGVAGAVVGLAAAGLLALTEGQCSEEASEGCSPVFGVLAFPVYGGLAGVLAVVIIGGGYLLGAFLAPAGTREPESTRGTQTCRQGGCRP